ncbi:MAG TPA: hypothetical protein VMY16_10170 [Ilumatobacteraceae bacterium]|nr:hypothetical protein [Ilumatobacteraceae bacterium]
MSDRVTDPDSTDVDAVVDAASDTVESAASDDPTTDRPKRRVDRGLLIASLAIALGLILMIFGFTTALTGSDGIDRPDAIESVQPVENAVQVLQQERVVVDLQSGYEARLVIDGIELPTTVIGQSDVDPFEQPAPGQQVDLPTTAVFDPGNNVVSFQPVEGALIESFTQGLHEVQVIFWKIEEGPEQALSYRWEFNVI